MIAGVITVVLLPCYLLMGLRGVNTAEGKMSLAMRTSPWLCNAFGVIYGGAIAFLADATIILAAGSRVQAGTAFNTMDLKVNFLRPVLPEMQGASRRLSQRT